MNKNYNETTMSLVKDLIYDQATEIVNDRYGDTLKEEERDCCVESEYEALVEFIIENLNK